MRLRYKLVISIIPIALLSAQAVILYSRRAAHTALMSNLQKVGLSKTVELARAMVPGFVSGSEKELMPKLHSGLQAGALYAIAIDEKGRVLAHTNVAETGKTLSDAATRKVLQARQPVWEEIMVKGQRVLDVAVPVWAAPQEEHAEDFLLMGEASSKRLGILRAGFPLAETLEVEDDISRQILWIVLVSSGLTTGLLLFFLRGILSPINLLSLETEKIGRGQYGRMIPVRSSDEIGELARRFNEMSRNLAMLDAAEKQAGEARRQSEESLRQSEKLSAVGQLAAGVAHEINNPLAIILGFAQAAIQNVGEKSELALPLKSIVEEALRCKNLVQDLLTFSRKAKPRMEPFDFNEAVESTLGLITAQARIKKVELVRELGPENRVMGDKNQIQQVVMNLCNNAIDAMPQGGQITLRTRASERDGKLIILEVEDTGLGIPKEIRKKIFDPFFTTKEPGKGTGLGLALVHEIVSRHHGTISVQSEPGKGSLFIVALPMVGGETRA